jgi:hypothetical protein
MHIKRWREQNTLSAQSMGEDTSESRVNRTRLELLRVLNVPLANHEQSPSPGNSARSEAALRSSPATAELNRFCRRWTLLLYWSCID